MKEISLSNKYLYRMIGTSTSPVGNKEKYYKDGIWYKKDIGFRECIVTDLLRLSDYPSYVSYERVLVNGRQFCMSKSGWTNEITINKIFKMRYGTDATNILMRLPEPKDKFNHIVQTVLEFAGIDISEYLLVLIYLDMLIGNYDRHYNNMGLIYDKVSGKYRAMPLFDNGDCLDIDRIEQCGNIGNKHEFVLSSVCDKIESPILFDYSKIYTDNAVLKHQLDKYSDIFKGSSAEVNKNRILRISKGMI